MKEKLYIYAYCVLKLIMLLFHPQDILLLNSMLVIERKATYFRV